MQAYSDDREGHFTKVRRIRDQVRKEHYSKLGKLLMQALNVTSSGLSVHHVSKELNISYRALSKVIADLDDRKLIKVIDQTPVGGSHKQDAELLILKLTDKGRGILSYGYIDND